MRGYYIYNEAFSSGVERKVKMQMEVLDKHIPCEMVKIRLTHKFSLFEKIYRSFPFVPTYDLSGLLQKINNPDYVYIRKLSINSELIDFLSDLKNKYPKCIVFMEFPVFPYITKATFADIKKALNQMPFIVKDLLYRKALKKYVDYITTFSNDSSIYGIPTLQIRNGIVVESIKQIENNKTDETIDLFSVAFMANHHGFERLIKGINNYYRNGGSRKVIYHMVGYGPEEQKYKELVKQLNLSDHVLFYGKKEGEELDEIYEKMDIAVASLGLYKIDLKIGSFIKTGEYLAKGIPMITGSPVDVLDHADFPYFLEFSNDDSPIDLDKVIEFYDTVYKNANKDVAIREIRRYAYKKVDMSVALREVTSILDRIKKEHIN